MDDHIWGSIINLIIILLKRRIRHWEYFGGQFKEVGNHYRVTSPYILKLNTLIYAVRFAFIGPSQVTTILIGHYYFASILGKRNAIKNFYLYHVLLATKVKDRPLRSVREEVSYTAYKGICSCAFDFSFDNFKPSELKHSPLSPMATGLYFSPFFAILLEIFFYATCVYLSPTRRCKLSQCHNLLLFLTDIMCYKWEPRYQQMH